MPDKPSIAVLPFNNLSGDAEQGYFADGITEDIITALSKFRWFFVIACNSTFTYKGSSVDITQVGRELGVRYVLEGSVRKAGNRVRISAQLIEAKTAFQKQAAMILMPISTTRQLFDLPGGLATKMSAEFYGKPADGAFKARVE